MKKFLATFVLILSLAGLAWAGPMGPKGPGHGPGHGPGIRPDLFKTWIELNLNDAQRKEAATILKGYRQQLVDSEDAVHKAFEQAGRPGSTLGHFDEAALRKKQAAVSSAMTEMIVLKEKVANELYAILTPDQQVIVKTRLLPPEPPKCDGVSAAPGKPGPPDKPGKPGEEGPGGPEAGQGRGPEHGPGEPGGPGFGGPGADGMQLIDLFIEVNS